MVKWGNPHPRGVGRSQATAFGSRIGNGARAAWHGKYGGRLLVQVVLVYALFALYKVGRYLAKGQVDLAFLNAHRVWRWEQTTGIANEATLQSLVLGSSFLILLLNYYYVMAHFSTAGAFLAWVYVFREPHYRHIRRLFVLSTFLALLTHIFFPLAPPRMLSELGFVDTMAQYGPTSYGSTFMASTANQFAAMPSVHFAWAVLVAYGVLRFGSGAFRWLVLLHPLLTLSAIVLTANHYWLDAAGALVVVALAFALEPLVARLPRLVLRRAPTGREPAPLLEGEASRARP